MFIEYFTLVKSFKLKSKMKYVPSGGNQNCYLWSRFGFVYVVVLNLDPTLERRGGGRLCPPHYNVPTPPNFQTFLPPGVALELDAVITMQGRNQW